MKSETRITEQPSRYNNLEKMTVEELTRNINAEDKLVATAVEEALPAVNRLIEAVVDKLKNNGRLFYLGAGSGGRLSVLDAIEMPTTYGVPAGLINVVLAGGKDRLVEALEEKEDDTEDGWRQLQQENVTEKDIVIGISASGSTPFVLASLKQCKANGITTGCLVSNSGSPIVGFSDYPVEVITGPEFVTGSTRMKCGTAQKMLFDMISTTTMICLGRVEDNKMVHVALINDKITDRAVRILMERTGIEDYRQAERLLKAHGSVKTAMSSI